MSQLLTLSEAIASHARVQPDKVGTRDSRRALTFGDWDDRASRLANGLLALGLNKGDRVVLLAYNCIEWMEIYVALARAGLVAVPVNFRLLPADISYIALLSEASALIAQDDIRGSLESIRAELPIAPHCWIHFAAPTPTGWQVQTPRSVLFIADAAMPRTATGKILHRKLREQLVTMQEQV